MPDFLVRLTIPVPVEHIVSVPALTFTHWLPMGELNAICVNREDFTLKLWFDLECLGSLTEVTEEELSRHINVIVDHVYADVTVKDVNAPLLAYMRARDFTRCPTEDEQLLQAEYDEVAEQVLQFALTYFNRLVSCVRASKGQYWLGEYEIDVGKMSSLFVHFRAKACFEANDWFRFGPTGSHAISVKGVSRDRYIAREDWAEIRRFVIGSGRTPLARTLLAGAEKLAAAGQSRSAITEGVTALEVALYEFARCPEVDDVIGTLIAGRLDLASLSQQIERLGLSASVRYLLPLLFSEELLPLEVLKGCREAITQRQNVVHNGQREVREDVLSGCLVSIRLLLDFFDRVTGAPADTVDAKSSRRRHSRQS